MESNVIEFYVSSKTHGNQIVKIDAEYLPVVSKHTWHIDKQYDGLMYLRNPQKMRMHRLIMGVSDPNILVDHKDGNGLNNCVSNLRIASRGQNQFNQKRRCDSTSGYRGVSERSNGKWVAYINHNGKRIWTKTFSCKHDAAKAYNQKAVDVFGAFARLNFVL